MKIKSWSAHGKIKAIERRDQMIGIQEKRKKDAITIVSGCGALIKLIGS